jgi:hypothetical protein
MLVQIIDKVNNALLLAKRLKIPERFRNWHPFVSINKAEGMDSFDV